MPIEHSKDAHSKTWGTLDEDSEKCQVHDYHKGQGTKKERPEKLSTMLSVATLESQEGPLKPRTEVKVISQCRPPCSHRTKRTNGAFYFCPTSISTPAYPLHLSSH